MKTLVFLLLAALITLEGASAAQVKYFTYKNKSEELVNITVVHCNENEANLCQYMCGRKEWCSREELQCTNCAGPNDLFLRLLFTRIQDNFVVTDEVWPNSNMIVYLADEYYVLVNYQSVFNFYKSWGSQEIQMDFQTFCPAGDEEPIFIISLNEKNQPQDVVGVVCSDEHGQSYVRVIRDKNINNQSDNTKQEEKK